VARVPRGFYVRFVAASPLRTTVHTRSPTKRLLGLQLSLSQLLLLLLSQLGVLAL